MNIYTVNDITFNKAFNTFATAGSDGTWVTWNYHTKSRYKLGDLKSPLTSAAFSPDGILLAVATGEDWSKGARGALSRRNEVRVVIRRMEREDVCKKKNS